MKKTMGVILALVLSMGMVAGCSSNNTTNEENSTTTPNTNSDSESGDVSKDYPSINFSSDEVFGVGPDGAPAGSLADVQLTDEEKQQIREGNYTVAFCYHQLDNQVNQVKLKAAQETFEELGIEVVSVTDAQSNADKLVSDIETTMALKPDVLLSMPYDPDATAAAYKEVTKAGTKLILMENAATGLEPGKDYATIVNSDSYGNGKYAADILAKELGYKGNVAMVVYDVPFFTTNERDRAFKEVMEKDYPDITIVEEVGFTDISRVGEAADALFATFPDVDGVYASWDIPAQDVIASAKSIGRDDLKITTVDLGENAARMIAQNDMIVGTGCPRSYESGVIEALATAKTLLGKKIPAYLASASQPIAHDNLLEGYKKAFHMDPPEALVKAYEEYNTSH